MTKRIEDYLAEISEKSSDIGRYVFRGQSNAEWPLRSAANRRLINHFKNTDGSINSEGDTPHFSSRYITYHCDKLIDPARTNGFGFDDGRMLSDIEILAKLQHFGAATGLLDFTRSQLIALWFAVQNDDHDGKVFWVDINDADLGNITHERMAKKLKDLLSEPIGLQPESIEHPLLYWEPIPNGEAGKRILIQRSVFVITARPLIPQHMIHEVKISKEDKKEIREKLENTHSINEESLFKDIYGFSSLMKVSSSISHFNSAEDYFYTGNRKYQQRLYADAIADYDEAIRLKPDYAGAYYNRGNAKHSLEQYEQTIVDYDEAIRLKPDYAKAYYNRGNAKHSLEQYEQAIADYDEAIRLKPDYAKAYYNRGNAKGLLGQYEQAIADYDEAIRIKPDFVEAYNNRGNAKHSLGQYEQAIADYDEAIRIKSDHVEAYSNRGATKHSLGQYEKAIVDCDEAIRLKPDYAEAYNNRGSAKHSLKQYAEAITDCDQAIRLKPDFAQAYSNRGNAKAALGQNKAAAADFEKAERLDPTFAE